MILIENSSNKVIISASNIILHTTHAEVERTKYYGGITDTTHTLISDKSVPYGQANWWTYETGQFTLTETGLSERKLEKKAEIKSAFESHENDPVEALSVQWNGGYESAMKLDAAKRMSELTALTVVTFFDLDNQAHSLSIDDATIVILTVGNAYQMLFQKKQSLYQQIDNANDATTLDAITW
jgi:hypothetical protein